MQSLKTEIGATIRDANGKVIRKVPFRRCHSLLKQFVQVLAVQMSQVARSVKDTAGTENNCPVYAANLSVAATTETTRGIVIGSGEVAAVTMEDYKLETQLTTNIAHQAGVLAVENPDSETWRLAIARGFINNTGASVAVKEVGLYGSQGIYLGCFDRTLYSVSFAAGETLTLTYRITFKL